MSVGRGEAVSEAPLRRSVSHDCATKREAARVCEVIAPPADRKHAPM